MSAANVVRLPSAAPRKVQQPTAVRCRRAVEAGAAVAIPVLWMTRDQRQRLEDEEAILSLERSPALLLAMALIDAAGEAALPSLLGMCIAAKVRNPECEASVQALAIVRRLYASRRARSAVRS